MLYKNLIFSFLIATVLSGCGFQPMLQNNAEGRQPFVLSVKGEGYAAYLFRREMEKQLAMIPRLSDEDYRVDIDVKGSQAASTVAQDATISRVNLSYTATYKVFQKKGKPLIQNSTVVSSYPVVPRDEFVSKNADLAATSRIMVSLAQEVALEVVRTIKQEGEKKPRL